MSLFAFYPLHTFPQRCPSGAEVVSKWRPWWPWHLSFLLVFVMAVMSLRNIPRGTCHPHSCLSGSARKVAAPEQEDEIWLSALSCTSAFSENSKDDVYWT